MRKFALLGLLFFLSLGCKLFADDIEGFWQTMDKDTNRPTSVIAVYFYQGKYYGRIIATFNEQGEIKDSIYHPVGRAKGIEGNPHYCGLDIVYNAQLNDEGKYKGFVIDPRKGSKYRALLWKRDGNLVLRGEVFVFGKNVVWPPFPEGNFTKDFKKPDLASFVPSIPKAAD